MKSYTYPYPHPSLTVDIILFSFSDEEIKVLLIKRGDEPFKDHWAFPGGFVDENETVEKAAERELMEETGLEEISMHQFYTASAPGRDPRGWTVSVVFYGFVAPVYAPVAGSDAKEVAWHNLSGLPRLAFDHEDIMDLAIRKIREETLFKITGDKVFTGVFEKADILRFYERILGSHEQSELVFERNLRMNCIVPHSRGKLIFDPVVVKKIGSHGFLKSPLF